MRYQQRRRADVAEDVVQLGPSAGLLRALWRRRGAEVNRLAFRIIVRRRGTPGGLHGAGLKAHTKVALPSQVGYRSIEEFQVARFTLAYDQKSASDGRMAYR